MPSIRKLHSTNAKLLIVFIVAHLANHLIALTGIENHLSTMEALRLVYRLPMIEWLLLILFASQIILGLLLARKRWKPKTPWARAQLISGLIVGFFLTQHIGALLNVRFAFIDLDTNFYWAASVATTWPLNLYFIPYYFIGVAAIFIHIACALHFRGFSPTIIKVTVIAGFACAAGIVLSVSGSLYSIELPIEHKEYIKNFYNP